MAYENAIAKQGTTTLQTTLDTRLTYALNEF